MNRTAARLVAGAIALLCGASVQRVRAGDATAPEPLETELIRARNMITNASSRVRNDIVGMTTGGGAAETLGRSCCGTNVEKIEGAIRESARILGDFDRCYEKEGDTDMVLRARMAQSDLAVFARTVPYFADSRTKGEAEAALVEMSRAYNALRRTAVGLAACGDVAERRAATEPSQDAPKAKDKKNKKKG
jgi:hypothetical protein